MAFAAAAAARHLPGDAADVFSVADLLATTPDGWWNPLSVGFPAALIFCLAILPGWITEQDPWQRVWAARNTAAACIGMLTGAGLIAIVFAACALIAVSLNRLYPEIAALGFPAGMPRAETALLDFITSGRFSPLVVALTAIGLAAAAMSCADTFAASGASCLARDIYQRFIRPEATMGQMLRVNRISVLVIIAAASAASFFIGSIIEAIHIATFIASAACFFPLMGGIFWKRGTREGALAGLAGGASVQVLLIATDLVRTPSMAPPFLESLSPLLMGHGVLVGMGLSGAAYMGVSLLTPAPDRTRLAPFFADEAQKLASAHAIAPEREEGLPWGLPQGVLRRPNGERTLLRVRFEAEDPVHWQTLVGRLIEGNPVWLNTGGWDALYRLTDPDLLGCVMVTRGRTERDIWLQAEPRKAAVEGRLGELALAYRELQSILGRDMRGGTLAKMSLVS
jgi:SSS family solute:Na+ symporter